MSKTLKKRVSELEKTAGSSREFYVRLLNSWDSVSLDIVHANKMKPKDIPYCQGPFKSRRDAHAWRLRYLQTGYPKAYARLLQWRSPKDLETTSWLTVDTFPEFIEEMLRTDVDLSTLSESDRKIRQSYLDHADDARALVVKHAELLRGGFQ